MIKIGSLVKSLKGHDCGRIYVVVDLKENFALLVDGKYRKMDLPKRKRIKHLKNLYKEYNKTKLLDHEIKTFLKAQSNLHK